MINSHGINIRMKKSDADVLNNTVPTIVLFYPRTYLKKK